MGLAVASGVRVQVTLMVYSASGAGRLSALGEAKQLGRPGLDHIFGGHQGLDGAPRERWGSSSACCLPSRRRSF